ncbi:MAG: hypothetical protein WCL23_01395, partial [Candidatus Moraniibacteriota bacterium]
MTTYVTQKTRDILISFLVVIVCAGMYLWWQGGPRPVFGLSLDLINVTLSVFTVKNEAVNGTFSVRFALYDTDRTDTASVDTTGKLWEETKEVQVRNGIIRTALGDTVALPVNLFTDTGKNYYLGIRIDSDSELVPRKKITSVPSALNAFHATDAVNAQNAITAQSAQTLSGKVTGTASGNIPVLGINRKIAVSLLPTGTGTKQLVLGNDGRLHNQNTDTGTSSRIFDIGSGTSLGSANFDLSVSNASTKPALRYDATAGLWQLSNNGADFNRILTAGYGGSTYLALSGGTMGGNIIFSPTQTFGVATQTELGYLSGVTGNIQAQIAGKAAAMHTHSAGDIVSGLLTTTRGGTGLDTSSSTGIMTVNAGVWSTASSIGVTLGGTGTTTPFTPGSVVYAGSSGVYSQDNSNFFYDPISHALGIGTTTPVAKLSVLGGDSLNT